MESVKASYLLAAVEALFADSDSIVVAAFEVTGLTRLHRSVQQLGLDLLQRC